MYYLQTIQVPSRHCASRPIWDSVINLDNYINTISLCSVGFLTPYITRDRQWCITVTFNTSLQKKIPILLQYPVIWMVARSLEAMRLVVRILLPPWNVTTIITRLPSFIITVLSTLQSWNFETVRDLLNRFLIMLRHRLHWGYHTEFSIFHIAQYTRRHGVNLMTLMCIDSTLWVSPFSKLIDVWWFWLMYI